MKLFDVMKIAGTGLTAQRKRMEVSASNLANVDTIKTAGGGPYKKKHVIFETAPVNDFRDFLSSEIDKEISGVRIRGIRENNSQPLMKYEPGHPEANAEGYVAYPAIEPVDEMIDVMSASRSYEANVSVIETMKKLAVRILEIGR